MLSVPQHLICSALPRTASCLSSVHLLVAQNMFFLAFLVLGIRNDSELILPLGWFTWDLFLELVSELYSV